MTDNILNDDELDAVFSAARGEPIALSDTAMDQVMAAAIAELEDDTKQVSVKPVSWWRELVQTLGGWPAMGGLATAAMVGVWIGVSPPTALEGMTTVFDTDTSEFEFWSNDFDLILSEG